MRSHEYLPLDVYSQIFAFLPRLELQKFQFMNSAFHQLVAEFLSKHVVLGSKTWLKFCTFLVEGKGARLLKRVKKLTVLLEDMPIVSPQPEDAPDVHRLFEFIQLVGPQLISLTLNGQRENSDTSLTWGGIHEKFRESLILYALPFIGSLEFPELTSLPLPQILSYCPNLRNIHMSANDDVIASNVVEESGAFVNIPAVKSMSFGVFADLDFDYSMTLFQFLQDASSPPTSLHFEAYTGESDFPLELSFLDPFDHLKKNLLSLSFGAHLFDTATLQSDRNTHLPLETFPSLRTMEFSVSTIIPSKEWLPWTTWLAAHFDTIPPSLEILRFTGIPLTEDFIDHLSDFDNIATASNIKIEFVFDGDSYRAHEIFQVAVRSLRLALPLWNSVGRLSFWLGFECE